MEVSGHLHTLATLFSGKLPVLATEQETWWAAELPSALGCFGEEKNFLITLCFLFCGCSLVTVHGSLSVVMCVKSWAVFVDKDIIWCRTNKV